MINIVEKEELSVDNMQIGLEAVIALIRIHRDFISIISDFLPKRSSNQNLFVGKDSLEENA